MPKKTETPIEALDEEILTSEEALAKAVVTLSETKRPKIMTRINEKEVKVLSALVTLGNAYDVDLLNDVCLNFMNLRVSLKGMGRSEILEIAKTSRDEKAEASRLKKIFGFGGRM
jgi:uncharacterized protein involved in exopolysaccharide biosynthesis